MRELGVYSGVETMKDLQELIQDDIICVMSGKFPSGGAISAKHINDCVSDLCDIVVTRIEEFENKEKKRLKTLDKRR